MTDDQFWQIIEASKAASDGHKDRQLEALEAELEELAPAEVVEFERIFGECADRAYRWDLWGAAYLIGGGCSDDAFIDFRNWLISMGRAVYEKALQDAESLVELDLGPDAEEEAFFEEFAYVATQVYEEQTGEEMPYPERESPTEPAGEEWDEDEEELARRFPRLWARYGDAVSR